MNIDTERFVKEPIAELLRSYEKVFGPPSDGRVREYELKADGLRFFADFAYRLPREGWLFIEDDDGPLANVTKYWFWLSKQPTALPVYLVHLIGPRKPGQKRLSEFVWREAHETYPGFLYRPVSVVDWHRPETWLPELRGVLNGIVEEQRAGGDGGLDARLPLGDEPFIGMWKDRQDMKDSTAWVRSVRREHWGPR